MAKTKDNPNPSMLNIKFHTKGIILLFLQCDTLCLVRKKKLQFMMIIKKLTILREKESGIVQNQELTERALKYV